MTATRHPSTTAVDQYDLARRSWVELLGRIRFDGHPQVRHGCLDAADIHGVALQVAAAADPSGARTRPDPARLAVELEVPYETAVAALDVLLELALLRQTAPANPYRAAEYRLVGPADLGQRIAVWSPRELAEAVAEAERRIDDDD